MSRGASVSIQDTEPVLTERGEMVAAHFHDFGMLRGAVGRKTSTRFALDLELDGDGREKLAAKIRWKKSSELSHVPDKREFKRVLPRHPRTVLTMADDNTSRCFVIDISQFGVAVSASVVPGKGTPVAIGGLLGRVVQRLDVGFAVEFIEVRPLEFLETRMASQKTNINPSVAA